MTLISCGWLLAAGAVALTPARALAADTTAEWQERFQGTATSESGALVYRETHVVDYAGEQPVRSRTEYFDLSGNKIAELRSDYRASPYAPTYVFVDGAGRTKEAAQLLNNGVQLQSEQNTKVLAVGAADHIVLGQGLHQFARAKLDELAGGRSLEVRFGIPSRLDLYDFKIDSEHCSNPDIVRLKIRISSWILALFAPSLEVEYERRTHRLLSYRGVSNLTGPDGQPLNVLIRYRYEEDAASVAKALPTVNPTGAVAE
ncbi:MAG: hypothetical protein ACLPJH_19865 [Myxococcaceae bacterium]